jgi:hypothetical protein
MQHDHAHCEAATTARLCHPRLTKTLKLPRQSTLQSRCRSPCTLVCWAASTSISYECLTRIDLQITATRLQLCSCGRAAPASHRPRGIAIREGCERRTRSCQRQRARERANPLGRKAQARGLGRRPVQSAQVQRLQKMYASVEQPGAWRGIRFWRIRLRHVPCIPQMRSKMTGARSRSGAACSQETVSARMRLGPLTHKHCFTTSFHQTNFQICCIINCCCYSLMMCAACSAPDDVRLWGLGPAAARDCGPG